VSESQEQIDDLIDLWVEAALRLLREQAVDESVTHREQHD